MFGRARFALRSYRTCAIISLLLALTAMAVSATPAAAETEITAEKITANTTWTAAGSPYVIKPSSIIVMSGVTLTIEPGVTVEFNPKEETYGGGMTVAGTVKAVASVGNPIVFTSALAGKGGTGAPGQWYGISVSSGNASSQFSYADFLFGGSGSGGCYVYGALQVTNGSTVPIEHSDFEYNEREGIHVNEATANVSYSTFRHNCDGLAGGGKMTVTHSEISYNTLEGTFGAAGVMFNGNAAESSFSYDTIRGNGNAGIEVVESCEKPLSYYPSGEHNNIYENDPTHEAGHQLDTFDKCPDLAVNWKNNYWGDAYFDKNPTACSETETPYSGHVAYAWARPEHSWEAPEGPITSNQKRYGAKESEYFSCAWDSFNVTELLSEPVAEAPSAPPELTPAELRGEQSGAVLNRRNCMYGDPVNCATGNLYETATDLTIPGLNGGLTFSRSYNSQAAASATSPGPMGYGWAFEFGETLAVDPNSHAVTITEANGATVTFMPKEGGGYTAPPWVQAKLVLNGEGAYEYTLPDQRVFTFNGSGELQKVADRNGNTTTLAYGSGGRLETITDPSSRKLTLAYNASGFIESVTDPMSHVVKYGYTGNDLTSVTLPGESSPRWQYKYESHKLTEVTDGRGGKATNKYDGSNRVIEQKDPLGRVTKWGYEGAETRVTTPTGQVVRMVFEGYLPVSITHGYGTAYATTETFGYDASGNLTSTTDGNGHTTKYTYDGETNRTSMVDPNKDETKWGYDSTHDVTSTTTPKGETTTIKRDSHGNAELIERPAPGGKTQTTHYKYDSKGDLESVEDPLKRVWKYEYDSKGDRTAETDPGGDKRTWGYNEDSSETSTVSPRGSKEPAKFTTKIERDEQQRPKTITDPLAHTTKYTYDGDGNLETLTEANGNTTKYEYNADNEPTKVIEPAGSATETEYDGEGHVVKQTDGNKHGTKYERNILGQVKEVIDPLGRKTTKEYDNAGNLTKLTDAAKRTTTYVYDSADRLTEVSYSDGKTPTVKYEYEADGDRTKMTDGTGTSIYEYDQLDRLTESKDGHGNTTAYEYDLANQPTKITYPNGKAVARTYDNTGRLEKVTDWLEHTTTFAYDADSDLTKATFPSGTSNTDTYTYNDADQLTKNETKKSTEVLASLTYAREKNGTVKTTTQKGLPGEEKSTDTYDEDSRLTKGGATEYKYDPANNPTTIGKGTYAYDGADELETGPGVTYTYDEVGQRTKTTPSSGPATSYGYDEAGNLIAVERPKEGETGEIKDSYAYNGNGLRTSQTISGTTSYLAWDITREVPVILNDSTDSYVYGPGGLPIEQINSEGNVLYLHHDQQGSTRLLTSATGTAAATATYDAYGNKTGSTGSATTALGYDAQYTSADTGLIYLRARVYDPATAQFTSVDALSAISLSRYSYGTETPLTFGDPSGLLSIFGVEVSIPGALHTVQEVGSAVAGVSGACTATLFWVPGVGEGCATVATISGTVATGAGAALAASGDGSWESVALNAGATALGYVGGRAISTGLDLGESGVQAIRSGKLGQVIVGGARIAGGSALQAVGAGLNGGSVAATAFGSAGQASETAVNCAP